ncbi:MAG TPA: hypothetical protein VHW65_13270, partial [Gemmatimonadales bacterium]|nr:hypothetical protein [Gemmatimonadales bacterium]
MKRATLAACVASALVVAGAAVWASLTLFNDDPTTLHVKSGELSIKWLGQYRGDATFPARITWCPVTRLGLIEGIAGDTGVAVVLYEKDAVTAGPHPVFTPNPVPGSDGPRPGATVAFRWSPAPDTLLGFRSEGGGVITLQLGKGTASGTIAARLHSVVKQQTL